MQFTAIIPNYNYAKWVGNAIDSVVNDPYDNKKIIVVDACSTDDSWNIICDKMNIKGRQNETILTGMLEGIPCVAYRLNKPAGPSKARNTGIKIMWDNTDVFGFLDSDDEYKYGKIINSIEKFKMDPVHIGAVYTDYYTIDEANILRREYKEPFSRERLMQECIVHSACIVKKEALQKCGSYDEEMRTCEDYDLWMRISESYCLVHIPEPLMLVRVGSHNSTATVKPEIWHKNWHRVMQKTRDRMQNNAEYNNGK